MRMLTIMRMTKLQARKLRDIKDQIANVKSQFCPGKTIIKILEIHMI